jgi:prepilin-type N-terminal cleavage/methylation domain-containing protein
MHVSRNQRDERGVTLVEVLIAMVILGIIMVPLTGALISFFRHNQATNNRLTESHDAQIAAAYFAQDMQSMGLRDWANPPYDFLTSAEVNVPLASSTMPCGTDTTALVRLAWDEPTGATTRHTVIVAYVVRGAELHRLRCVDGNLTDLTLVRDLVSVNTPTPTGTAGHPDTMTLTMTIRAPTNSGAALPVTLYGQRRQTT